MPMDKIKMIYQFLVAQDRNEDEYGSGAVWAALLPGRGGQAGCPHPVCSWGRWELHVRDNVNWKKIEEFTEFL